MRILDVVQLVLALILTAVGIILGHILIYGYFLLAIAILLVVLTFAKQMYLLIPKIYYDKNSASNAVSKIYEESSKEGGRLIATHINPGLLRPSEDIAIEHLKKTSKPLEYKRLIFQEDKLLEDGWIRNTLANVDPKVQPSIYFVKHYLLVPNILWSVIPRANILLYNRGNRYVCLLGLDRLQTVDPHYEHWHGNFAIEFHSKEVFDILSRYFDSWTANTYVNNVKSITQYASNLDERIIRPEIQSVLSNLLIFANSTEKVLHVGLFGKSALQLNGLERFGDWEEHESDVDVMVIVQHGSVNGIKEKLKEVFNGKKDVEIVWGDDQNYFYFFRSEGKITVDIEIHEIYTEFYKEHPLLGCSIFAYYHTLFTRSKYLHELLQIPYGYNSINERLKILLNDRKGINEFKSQMSLNSLEIDPRRIISICVKNVAWALSGVRPANSRIALAFLSHSWQEIFPSVNIKEIYGLLNKNLKDIKRSYKEYRDLSQALVNDLFFFCTEKVIYS